MTILKIYLRIGFLHVFLFRFLNSSTWALATSTNGSIPGYFEHPDRNSSSSRSRKHLLSQSDHMELIRKSLDLFLNKTLIVCVVVREPFVIYKESDNSSPTALGLSAQEDINNYSGVAIEVVKRLKLIFKFQTRIIRPKDNQFGVLTASNGWTGLMGSLARNESDLGVTSLSITVNRAKVVDFTRAFYVETAAILLRIPEEVQNYLAIFEPFSLGVWLTLLATIVILIFLITIMTRLEEEQREQHNVHRMIKLLAQRPRFSNESGGSSKSTQNYQQEAKFQKRLASISQPRRQEQEFGSTWADKFYYATSCVLNILLIRDIKQPPSQTPIRILVCLWWLSTIVIVNIYLGILFGQLVIPQRPRSIETLEELVNQQQVDWCVTRGTGMFELFRESKPDTIYGQLGNRMHNVTTADEGVRRVSESGWAFIRERSILTFKVAQEHNRIKACRLQLAREEFMSVGFGLALVKGSKYLKPFNAALTLMIENGFVSRWQSMYWPTRNQFTECKLQPLREGEPLSLKHFISIYLVASLIIAISAAILLYQNVHERLYVARIKPIYLRFKQAMAIRRPKAIANNGHTMGSEWAENHARKGGAKKSKQVIKFEEPEKSLEF